MIILDIFALKYMYLSDSCIRTYCNSYSHGVASVHVDNIVALPFQNTRNVYIHVCGETCCATLLKGNSVRASGKYVGPTLLEGT